MALLHGVSSIGREQIPPWVHERIPTTRWRWTLCISGSLVLHRPSFPYDLFIVEASVLAMMLLDNVVVAPGIHPGSMRGSSDYASALDYEQ
jgi:hypothetical protein